MLTLATPETIMLKMRHAVKIELYMSPRPDADELTLSLSDASEFGEEAACSAIAVGV